MGRRRKYGELINLPSTQSFTCIGARKSMTEKRRCGAISGVGGHRGAVAPVLMLVVRARGRGVWGTAGSHPAPQPGLLLEVMPLNRLSRLPRKTGCPLRELPRFLLTLINVGQGPRFPHNRDEVPELVGADASTGIGWGGVQQNGRSG